MKKQRSKARNKSKQQRCDSAISAEQRRRGDAKNTIWGTIPELAKSDTSGDARRIVCTRTTGTCQTLQRYAYNFGGERKESIAKGRICERM
jgi:hypothetical protein